MPHLADPDYLVVILAQQGGQQKNVCRLGQARQLGHFSSYFLDKFVHNANFFSQKIVKNR
jgi:hypothetical protein